MILDVERLKPGMILLEDVLMPNGSVLVNAGKEVTESLIEILLNKKIDIVQIVPDNAARNAAADLGATNAHVHPVPQDVLTLADEAAAMLAGAQVNSDSAATPLVQPDKPDCGQSVPLALQQDLPDIKVVISEDELSAKLSVAPNKAGENRLTLQSLTTALSNAGVIHGVDEKGLRGIVDRFAKLKRLYELDDAAKGTRPQPGSEGEFEFCVRHLNSESVIEEVKQCTHYWQLVDQKLELDRIDPGTVIARRKPGTEPQDGISVTGAPIVTREMVHVDLQTDQFVASDPGKTTVTATQIGVAYRNAKGVIGVIPLDFNGVFELKIASSFMRAEVQVRAPGPKGKPPTIEGLAVMLRDKGVVFGVDNENVEALGQQMRSGVFPPQPVCVAQALAPTNGEEGRFELLFNTETSLKPKVNADGSLDYKNIDIIASVSAGDKLAKLHPPTKGVAGKDIRGQVLPAGDGIAALLPVGTNTQVSPEDAQFLVATADGNATFNGTVVEVVEGYAIKGNVDYSSGNVRYKKSVTVGGDVVAGFSVTCGGDLQVNGTVEDCEVMAGGNVLVRAGFVGSGKGLIESRGDTNVGFLKNQKIRSRGSVSVAREVINGSIYARKSIYVHGSPLSVAGGTLVARDLIELSTVGNIGGIKTMIEVGIDYVLQEELLKTEHQMAETTENLRKILETYKKYEQMMAQRKGVLPPREKELYGKIKETLVKYQNQIKALESRIGEINSKLYNTTRACVKIKHAAFPGTIIKIGERHLMIKEELVGPKTIRLVNFEIKVL